jgi:GNAT superfamily N-acetyltransferase
MNIEVATDADFDGFVKLAAEVEHLFGPMVNEVGFQDAVRRNISRGSALMARDSLGAAAGGLLFSHHRHPTCSVRWFVVAEDHRSRGLGEALLADAFLRWVLPPCTVEVVTFGADHPGARARTFFERVGFRAGEPADAGPEGGSRQVFRMQLAHLPYWVTPHDS